MNVRLDEPRKNVAAARLDDAIVTLADVRRDRDDETILDRHVALDDVVRIVHRHDGAAAYQQGRHSGFKLQTSDFRLGGDHRSAVGCSLPCFTAMSSARMLTAISCGVTAPMSRPIGAWTRDSNSFGMPCAVNSS